MLIFCAIATPRPRAPTSCNPFVRRFNVACTPAQPQSCLASHNFQQGRTRSSSATRATSTAHLLRNARRKCTSHTTASAAVGAQRIRPAAFFLPTCSQHATTALPRLPCRTPPRCSLLCLGRAPSAALCAGRRIIQALAWPARPPSPALYMCGCVCVGCCNVPVPVDVFLTFGSAAACCSVASAFVWFGRCVRCRFRLLVWFAAHPPPLATHTPCTPHTPHSPHSHHTQHNPPTPRTLHLSLIHI